MDQKMYTVTCDPMCGFSVKSHDHDETVNLAYIHVTDKHKEKGITREQVTDLVQVE